MYLNKTKFMFNKKKLNKKKIKKGKKPIFYLSMVLNQE